MYSINKTEVRLMKRFLSFLLVAVMICMAIPALGAAEEPVTLRVAWWGSQTRHD